MCVLLLLTDAVVFQETIARADGASLAAAYSALASEAGIALLAVGVAALVLRKKYSRQKRPANRWRFAPVQPLRRLFVSVWS